MNKNLTIILAIVVAVAIVGVGVYAAVTIWSDPVTVNPQAPTVTVTPSSTTPDYETDIILTAELSVPSDGILITFFVGETNIGTAVTTGGIATKTYTVGIAPFDVKVSALIT